MTKISNLFANVYGVLGYRTYYSFSYKALDLIFSDHYRKWNYNPFNYYEFDTGDGNSIREFYGL